MSATKAFHSYIDYETIFECLEFSAHSLNVLSLNFAIRLSDIFSKAHFFIGKNGIVTDEHLLFLKFFID